MGSRQHTPQTTFSVKWQKHESNLKNQFDQFLSSQAFVDATLVCNDICIRLHKSVIAASSSYLRNILLQLDSREHPVIILQDTDEVALQSLVSFMYTGEVNVAPEHLPATLRCAETLKINGFLEAYAKNPPQVEDDAAVCRESDAPDDESEANSNFANQCSAAASFVVHSPVVQSSFESDAVMPSDLVDVSMRSEDAPPPEPPQKKRGRGRPKKQKVISPQPSSSKVDFVVKLEHPDRESLNFKSFTTLSRTSDIYSREPSLEDGEDELDPDASQNYSPCLQDQLDLPPLSPSSFSCGLETELNLKAKRRSRPLKQQVFTCGTCHKVFGRKHHQVQHERTHDKSRDTFQCSLCERLYHRRSELVRHQKHAHLDGNSNSNS